MLNQEEVRKPKVAGQRLLEAHAQVSAILLQNPFAVVAPALSASGPDWWVTCNKWNEVWIVRAYSGSRGHHRVCSGAASAEEVFDGAVTYFNDTGKETKEVSQQ